MNDKYAGLAASMAKPTDQSPNMDPKSMPSTDDIIKNIQDIVTDIQAKLDALLQTEQAEQEPQGPQGPPVQGPPNAGG